MKKSDQPLAVKLVTGLLYREEEWFQNGLEDLTGKFGHIDFHSGTIPFRYTDYYFREMGEPLFRKFVSFESLIDPSELMEIKVFTNLLEEKYQLASAGRRVLNMDPGYLNATAYILATSKNYAHRIYLGKGVFAQQELLFEKNRIQTLDWTYPDYRTVEYQDNLKKIKTIYLNQIKNLHKTDL